MSATGDLIAALVAGGMNAAEAAGLVARAAVEMTGALTKRSSAAIRQQRYRERNKASQTITLELQPSVTNRNETVTERNAPEASQTVTERNESVTCDAASLSKEVRKIEIKKREGAKGTQLADGWRPEQKHWDEAIAILGSDDRAERELRKFKLHAADKGRVAKNWGAAWVKWALQAIEYGARNGNGTSSYRADPAAGRATARETQHVASMGSAALRYLQEGKSAGQGRELPDSPGLARIPDPLKGTENAH